LFYTPLSGLVQEQSLKECLFYQERLKFTLLASEDFNATGAKLPVAGAMYVIAGALKSGFRPNALSTYYAS